MPRIDPSDDSVRRGGPAGWAQQAISALVTLAATDEGEGGPVDVCESLVALLTRPPFAYRGAAVYSDGVEGWTRVAAAGAIAQPCLPVGGRNFGFTQIENDLRLALEGGGGGWVLVIRRGSDPLAEPERGVLEQLINLVSNLLDQRTYVALLTRSERHYRHLYAHANLGIFFSRIGGGLQHANPGLLAMLGYGTEREMREDVGRRLDSGFYDPPADRQRLINAILAAGQVRDFKTRLRRADGSLVPVSMSACMVQDPDAQPDKDVEYFGFVTDLSADDRAREALHGQRRAEADNLSKVRFLASMSHELRTPLNGVLGMLDVLGLDDLQPEQQAAVEVIRRSAGQIVDLVDRMYDYTSLETGALVLAEEPFSPAAVAEAAAGRWQEAAAAGGLQLTVEIAAGVAAEVRGDARRCGQVIDQLLDNAVKFTPRGGRVSLELAAEGDALLFAVSDTGCGLAPDALEALFCDASLGDDGDLAGVGLGLALVRRLVDLMDGRVWGESEIGRGSRFAVLLPLPRVASAADAGNPADAVPETAGPECPRALIVEDNPVNQLVARKLLASLGLDVSVAEGGREALAMAAHRTFDLVFMDLQMPDLDGFSTTRALRSECGYQGPVIAMTAHATQFHRDKCRHTGMNGFVTKPLQRQRLAAYLEQLASAEHGQDDWFWLEVADEPELQPA